jgi:hypothetical protein
MPAIVATSTGKKAMNTEKTTLAVKLWPNQIRKTGASATFGMSWKKTIVG